MTQEITDLKERLKIDPELRNQLGRCPCCNSNIEDRHVTLYRGLIKALYSVYRWCRQNHKHEFRTKDIKHLLGKNEYARFGDLTWFGGIVYKPKPNRKAWFGINMTRAREFFEGTRQIPLQVLLNQITNEIVESKYVSVGEFPELKDLLSADGLYNEQLRLI